MNWLVVFLIVLLVSTVVIAVVSMSTVEALTQQFSCYAQACIGDDCWNACSNVR